MERAADSDRQLGDRGRAELLLRAGVGRAGQTIFSRKTPEDARTAPTCPFTNPQSRGRREAEGAGEIDVFLFHQRNCRFLAPLGMTRSRIKGEIQFAFSLRFASCALKIFFTAVD